MRLPLRSKSSRLGAVSLLVLVLACQSANLCGQTATARPGNSPSLPIPTQAGTPSPPIPVQPTDSSRSMVGSLKPGDSAQAARIDPQSMMMHAEPPSAPPLPMGDSSSGTVGPLKFGDLTIDAALDLLEQWTGRIVLRPQALPATSLVLSINHPIPKAEAVQALDTVLNLNGIAVAPMGDKFLKVTPLAQIRSEAPELIEGSTLDLPPSGRVAVKLFEFQFLTASELMPQLSSLLSPGIAAAPVIVEKANAALVTDTISNLQRIEKLITQMDKPSINKLTPKFYSLTNAKASDVANSVRSLLSGTLSAQIGSSVTIQADDRTNQLIVICDSRQQPFFDELITKLNSKGETNTRQEVIQLKHAVSKDVATLLTQLVAGRKQATGTGTGQQGQTQSAAQLAAAAAARRNTPGANPATPGAPGAPATVATAVQAVAGDAVTEFSSMLTILSDDRSNSLVVSGTVDDISIIRELVGKIDILLAQVRIEALICEVSLDDSETSGIAALGLVLQAGKLIGFSGNTNGSSVAVSGPPVTAVGGTASPFASFGPGYDLSATIGLATTPRKNNFTVLSAPTIVTTHNQEATIFVGESLPIITNFIDTGTTTTTSGNLSNGLNSTVTYKDIGIQVKVKPLIGNDGALELQISTEVNDTAGNVNVGGNAQPIITKRTTESFVSVRNGEIIVLGGLQKKNVTNTTSRLGPIPFLGDLLGSRTKDKGRDDLVFFLRPYILTNTPDDNTNILNRMEKNKQGDEIRTILHDNSAPPAKSP